MKLIEALLGFCYAFHCHGQYCSDHNCSCKYKHKCLNCHFKHPYIHVNLACDLTVEMILWLNPPYYPLLHSVWRVFYGYRVMFNFALFWYNSYQGFMGKMKMVKLNFRLLMCCINMFTTVLGLMVCYKMLFLIFFSIFLFTNKICCHFYIFWCAEYSMYFFYFMLENNLL